MQKKRLWPLMLGAPLFVLLTFAVFFLEGSFWPFGDRTVSWCDMDQQVLPLLAELRDVLTDREGFLLSSRNAGGMNFWGVFFFFLASPLSLLVLLFEKSELMGVMNLLTALKLALCAFTAALYFGRKAQKDGRGLVLPLLLAVSYAFSVYGLMYFQNSIWLDEMYLFPLLFLALDRLTEENKLWPYTLTVAWMVAVNYYIGFMVALFTLLRMGCFFLLDQAKNKKKVAWSFLGGSLLALGLSAFAWLPSLLQFLGSARGESILDNLAGTQLVRHMETTLPLLFGSAAALAVLLLSLFSGDVYPREHRGDPVLLILLVIPVFLEPVNLLWHAGSYMSFPCRFVFMTVFTALVCLYRCLGAMREKAEAKELPAWGGVLLALAGLALAAAFSWGLLWFYGRYADSLDAFRGTLWGDDTACRLLALVFGAAFLCYLLFALFYRLGLKKGAVLLMAGAVLLAECCFDLKVYMFSRDPSTENYRAYLELEAAVPEQEEFVRVKSKTHVANENWEGMLGLPSAAHYTSLGSEDWLFLMKRLGYNTYWMKIASYGGTRFSDALLSMRYQISKPRDAEDPLFANDRYALSRTEDFLPLGLFQPESVQAAEDETRYLARLSYQELLFEGLFPGLGPLFTEYTAEKTAEGYVWELTLTEPTELYFDAFRDYTTRLNEPINGCCKVYVNGRTVSASYPSQEYNSVLDLGEFPAGEVKVTVVTDRTDLPSFGVWGLSVPTLERAERTARAEDLSVRAEKNGYSGSYRSADDTRIFLAIPYQEGYTLTLNGVPTPISRTARGFVSFEAPAGSGEFTIRFTPPGLMLSLYIGGGTLLVWIAAAVIRAVRFRTVLPTKKKKTSGLALVLCKTGIFLVFVLIYFFPLIWNLAG